MMTCFARPNDPVVCPTAEALKRNKPSSVSPQPTSPPTRKTSRRESEALETGVPERDMVFIDPIVQESEPPGCARCLFAALMVGLYFRGSGMRQQRKSPTPPVFSMGITFSNDGLLVFG